MIEALNTTPGGQIAPSAIFDHAATPDALDTVTGRAVLRRLDAATDSEFPERDAHIEQIALVVLHRKGVA